MAARATEPLPLSSIRSGHRLALLLSGCFVVFGLVWVFATDVLLYAFVRNPALQARIETAKGWVFVGVSGVLLYVVIRATARKLTRAREMTRAVIESIGDGVLLLGRQRSIVYANPAAVRMLHCASADELLGLGGVEFTRRYVVSRPDGSLVAPDQLVSQRVFDEDRRLMACEILRVPGGQELVFEAIAAPVRYERDTAFVVSIIHDITNTYRLDQLRDQIITGAAHALKTPVAIIRAHAQMMTVGENATQLRQSIEKIEAQAQRMDRLVQNLLVLARSRSSSLRLHTHALTLGPLVERTVREMIPASTGDHEIRLDVDPTLRVCGDGERLALVVRNLIDEGCRSSPSGDRVTVIVRREGTEVRLGIRYHRLPAAELAPAEWDDLEFGRTVVSTLATSHGGGLEIETTGDETLECVRLPAREPE